MPTDALSGSNAFHLFPPKVFQFVERKIKSLYSLYDRNDTIFEIAHIRLYGSPIKDKSNVLQLRTLLVQKYTSNDPKTNCFFENRKVFGEMSMYFHSLELSTFLDN